MKIDVWWDETDKEYVAEARSNTDIAHGFGATRILAVQDVLRKLTN